MTELDPGHDYVLDVLDAQHRGQRERLTFVKRVGEEFPGNRPPAYAGTTTQEVLRALIARTKYVDGQRPSPHNGAVLRHLRSALVELEMRAAYERGDEIAYADLIATPPGHPIEDDVACRKCGHVLCGRHGP